MYFNTRFYITILLILYSEYSFPANAFRSDIPGKYDHFVSSYHPQELIRENDDSDWEFPFEWQYVVGNFGQGTGESVVALYFNGRDFTLRLFNSDGDVVFSPERLPTQWAGTARLFTKNLDGIGPEEVILTLDATGLSKDSPTITYIFECDGERISLLTVPSDNGRDFSIHNASFSKNTEGNINIFNRASLERYDTVGTFLYQMIEKKVKYIDTQEIHMEIELRESPLRQHLKIREPGKWVLFASHNLSYGRWPVKSFSVQINDEIIIHPSETGPDIEEYFKEIEFKETNKIEVNLNAEEVGNIEIFLLPIRYFDDFLQLINKFTKPHLRHQSIYQPQ